MNDVYSDPLYRVGDLVMILKDTRPGVSYKDSYDKEGKFIMRAELQLLYVIVFFIKRFPTKWFGGMEVNMEATFQWLSMKCFL